MYYMFTNDLVFSLIDSFLAQHDYFFTSVELSTNWECPHFQKVS